MRNSTSHPETVGAAPGGFGEDARSWRSETRIACMVGASAFGFRVLTSVLALFISLAFPLDQPRQMTVFADPSPFWDTFARFDSGWYEGIARNGYAFTEGGRGNLAYFPVYPMLMRYVGRVFGRYHAAFYFGGIVVSWTSFVLAMVALYYLARLDLPRRHARRAVLLTAVFPFAFFFGLVYSEATFLLWTVLAFLMFRTRRWMLGGVVGALAIATRTPAFLMWPALAIVAWQAARPTVDDRARAAVGLALTMTGFAVYCAYVYSLSGNPFEWAATLERWGYHPGGPPWQAPLVLARNLLLHPYAYVAGTPMGLYDTLYGVTGILFLVFVPFVWRRLGAGYALFILINLIVPLSSGVFEGVGRYCAVQFPAFIWLASMRSRFLGTVTLVLFALFYTLGLALFTTLHPLF
jgi:hypothetical protein